MLGSASESAVSESAAGESDRVTPPEKSSNCFRDGVCTMSLSQFYWRLTLSHG